VRTFALLATLLASCGGAAAIGNPPPPSTTAKLLDGGCGGQGARTEIALGAEHGAVWATLGGERMYTTSRECFALPALAAPQTVVLRARADGGQGGVGLSARLTHGGREALAVTCGDPGRCTVETLRAWAASRPHADACAGAVIRSLRWDSGGGDGVTPDDVEIRFEIVPRTPPDTCNP
jgi:hypothetical protein